MKVLITGGAGFIGSALVRYLIGDTDADVVVFDKLTYAGNLNSLAPISDSNRLSVQVGDIANAEDVRAALRHHQPDAVMHLAAESHVDRSIDAAADFVRTNVLGTFELLEAVRAYWQEQTGEQRDRFRFLHVSTDEVYGDLTPWAAAFNEHSRYQPSSPYSASKAGADHLVRAWYRTYGLPAIISTCSNNYGPYQFPEKLIPHMILNARARQPLPIYGAGEQIRDWIFVEDHVEALWQILQVGHPGETYHVGGNNQMTNLAVVRAICAALQQRLATDFDFTSLISYVTDRPGHDQRYAMDTSKLQNAIGWTPRMDFASGLQNTIDWYLDNEDWCNDVLSGNYRLERKGLAQHE